MREGRIMEKLQCGFAQPSLWLRLRGEAAARSVRGFLEPFVEVSLTALGCRV